MDLIHNLLLGVQVAATPANLAWCFVGVLLGTLVGVLPGISPVSTIAMLLPLSFGLPPVTGLIMMAGIYYGAQYGGSTSAILVNLPGEASSVVTCLDGHAMARQGRAGLALTVAALSSCFAGCVATAAIAGCAPPLSRLALAFGPAEYSALMILGLTCVVVLSHDSLLKSVAMIGVGLLLGAVGTDPASGIERFTFGLPELSDGINFVVLATGLFGVTDVLVNLQHPEIRHTLKEGFQLGLPGHGELGKAILATVRGTGVGTLVGALPGGGAILASFSAYALEKRISSDPSRFGRGAIEGVAAPEAANNAGAQTSFIPMLTLGIPSNAVMAMMLGALTIHGIVPGPDVITHRPDLFWGLISSMWIGNALLVILNLPLIGLWVRLLSVPYRLLYPAILFFSAIGVYTTANSATDVLLTACFGLVGYMLMRLEFDRVPLLLGFVLGPILEENLRRVVVLSKGSPSILLESPICVLLLSAAGMLLVLTMAPGVKTIRAQAL